MKRRELVISAGLSALCSIPRFSAAAMGRFIDYPEVAPGVTLSFPRDHGAHSDYRTEWWYVTGVIRPRDTDPNALLGFQVTFFRSRLDTDPENPSAFAPHQMLFGHAALSDPRVGHLVSEQVAARVGLGLAEFSSTDLDLKLSGWSLKRDPKSGRLAIRVRGPTLQLSLDLMPSQSILPEGEDGFSRKGPALVQASEYYSWPHLNVAGSVTATGMTRAVEGEAWLDREWSSDYLAQGAAGWDWTGINLDDGGAAMAFRIRQHDGAVLWAGGTLRHPDGTLEHFSPDQIVFTTQSTWRSPRTGITYPVAQQLALGPYLWQLEPIMADQELDSNASTGTIYWEGAVRATPASPGTPSAPGISRGHGYLELTGYDRPLKF